MTKTSQQRAIRGYRERLAERGMARFEVLGLDTDRELVRALARRLSEDGSDAVRLRAGIESLLGGEPPTRGGVLDALRRSPLVDADIVFERNREPGRDVDL